MNAAEYAGADDWRLWSALNSDGSRPCGPAFGCDDSELGHLFYVEGGLSARDAINDSTALASVFTNMQNWIYWSSTVSSASDAWDFNAGFGVQVDVSQDSAYYGWAVRPGQIAAAPLPGTALLMALGLAGLGSARAN